MLTDFVVSDGLGKITKYVQPETSIVAVLNFVEELLPEFARKCGGINNEKGLTDKLIGLLTLHTAKSIYPFRFIKDTPEDVYDGNSPTIDIGVCSNQDDGVTILTKHYHNDDSFFALEAKRLSTKITKNRRREYLAGHFDTKKRYIESGGIERFKKSIHGRHLFSAGIIGYVQDNDYSFWYSSINGWIDELASVTDSDSVNWTEDDKLVLDKCGIVARYKSNNSRIAEKNILLYHLWIYIQAGLKDDPDCGVN
jgi:hypothetical protein